MRLYLVRHATPKNPTDIDSPLGKEGIEEAKMLGRLFAALQLQPESLRIISSHLQRARQTATHICQEMGIADEAHIYPTKEEWSPSTDVTKRLMAHLENITAEEGCSEVIVVGHFPYVGEAAGWLVGQDALSPPDIYGATACLTCKPSFGKGTGVLDWLIVPFRLQRPHASASGEGTAPD